MMRPQRVRSMGSSKGWVTRKKPFSETSITRCHCAARMPGNTASSCTPALLMMICTAPCASISAQAWAVAASSHTSNVRHCA